MLFITFWQLWLWNELRTTAACTFSKSQLPKGLRRWGVLGMFMSKFVLGHNGVQFILSHLTRWHRIRRFSDPTLLDPRKAQCIGKTQCFMTFLPCSPIFNIFNNVHPFSHTEIFFLLLFSSLALRPSVAPSVHKSEVWLLNFLRLYHHISYIIHISYIYKQWIIFKAKAKELRRASPLWGRKSKELGSDETAEAAGNMVSRGAGHRSLQLIHHVPGAVEPWSHGAMGLPRFQSKRLIVWCHFL